MNAWEDTTLVGIYTITPLHLGSGQVSGAVDLPITRDSATGFPLIPATSLKGVARENVSLASKKDDPRIEELLFGKTIDAALTDADGEGDQDNANTATGQLCFSEARLVAYPARSLNRPFVHITCPLILERLWREARAFGVDFDCQFRVPEGAEGVWASVSSQALDRQPLIIEDLLIDRERVVFSNKTLELAKTLASLIPASDAATQDRFIDNLVVLRDADFNELMERIIPIRARTKLTGGKTTDKWKNPETNKEESGNLWYEEHLPTDCLFASFVGARRYWRSAVAEGHGQSPVATFNGFAEKMSYVQIGGDETVGHGICYWHFATAVAGGASGEGQA